MLVLTPLESAERKPYLARTIIARAAHHVW